MADTCTRDGKPHSKISTRTHGYFVQVGTLCKVDGNINAVKYRDILDNHLWPVLARHFADKPYRFQDDNAPVHRARLLSAIHH
jgi:hypothetical protein